jgi:hypothetical protein
MQDEPLAVRLAVLDPLKLRNLSTADVEFNAEQRVADGAFTAGIYAGAPPDAAASVLA